MKVPIIYEDNHLLVINKPPNVLSQADRTGDEDMVTILKQDLKVRYNKPGEAYLGLIQRLDRPVGGVMVFAKTSKAASRLSAQIRERKFRRDYLAVVWGRAAQSARLTHYLLKDRDLNIVTAVAEGVKESKKAVLDYELLGRTENLSLLAINLVTGRSHQIRVQLAAAGFPLFGDIKYGKEVNRSGWQIALFCRKVSFLHPTLKETVVFSQLPEDIYPWNLFALSHL